MRSRISVWHSVGAVWVLVWLCGITSLAAEWNLWPSPTDDRELVNVDQEQPLHEGALYYYPPDESGPIGQQFVPSRDMLYRLDLRLDGVWDHRPATFKLWTWDVDRKTTVSKAPIFTDTLTLTGGLYERLVSVYPRISIHSSQMLYFEVIPDGRDRVAVGAHLGPNDSYAAGQAWFKGSLYPTWDVWFKTYDEPTGWGSGPSLEPSNTSLPWQPPNPPDPIGIQHCPHSNAVCPVSVPYTSNTYTRCDYYCRVKDYLFDQGCFNKSCGQSKGEEPLIAAVLYEDSCRRGNCDQALADDAIAMMLEHYDCQYGVDEHGSCPPYVPQDCGCNSAGTGTNEFLGVAYQLIKKRYDENNVTMDPDEQSRIRCAMIDSARNLWSSQDRQIGAGGWPFSGGLMFLLTTKSWEPFSGDPKCPEIDFTQAEHDAWLDFAEANWTTLWDARSWPHDSSNYLDNLMTRMVMQYAYYSDREELLWTDADFRKLVDNLYNQLSPLGLDGNFGENAGVGELQSALIWMFEKAAEKYNDAKYKWLAHQIYRFNETRFCGPRNPKDPEQVRYFESFENDISDIAFAYLEASDMRSDASPAAQGEVLGANQLGAPTSHLSYNVGQTFKPTESPLVRIELQLQSNNGYATPNATISLWEWDAQGGYWGTIAQPPLFSDTVSMATVPATLVFYPFLEVDKDKTYFVQVSRPERKLALAGTTNFGADQYPGGTVIKEAFGLPLADLKFKTYSLSHNGSTYTTRRTVSLRTPSTWPEPCPYAPYVCNQWFEYGSSIVPDKLVLRSGYQPGDFHVLFNLGTHGYEHSDWNPGSLSLMTAGESILMAEAAFPYWRVVPRTTIDNTIAEVRRYWGGTYIGPPDAVTMNQFTDTRQATIAWFSWNDVRGWDVVQQRRLFFVKNRLLWVRDYFKFNSEMETAVGTVWHAGDIHPTYTSNWYQLYYKRPLANVYEQRNWEGYVSLYLIPKGTEDIGAFREATYDPPAECTNHLDGVCETVVASQSLDCRSSPPFVVYHRWKGTGGASSNRYMDALLIPHSLPLTAPPNVAVLYDDGTNVAIRVVIDDETWTLVDNPGGMPIDGDGIATDAVYLIARTKEETPIYLLTNDASQVEISPSINITWPVRTSVEIGGD